MANQEALGAWTRHGEEIVVQRWAHVTTHEAGAPGHLHGLQTITLGDRSGRMDPGEVRAAIRPDHAHCPRTALVCLEQTHNMAGGTVIPMQEIEAVSAVAREAGVPVHLDGARLANAVVASGIPAQRWAEQADSVSICLSKGLGAPVGSLVAGGEDFVRRATVVRKRLGGGMRQAGVIAAAGLVALEHNVERLSQDHRLARTLAQRLAALDGLAAEPAAVDTNIVMVTVEREDLDAEALVEALAARGVLVMAFGERILRFCTHLGVGAEDVERLERAARAVLAGEPDPE
jgi:threonine aldolase